MANNQKQSQTKAEKALYDSQNFFDKYKKQIFVVLGAILIVIVGVFLYREYVQKPKIEKANTELGKGQEYFANQFYDRALNGDSIGYIGFKGIIKEYGGTKAANLANLYAGLCQANMDKWPEAVEYLKKFNTSNDVAISPSSMAALGNAYAHVGKIDEATKSLSKAADMADKQSSGKVNFTIAPTFRLQAAVLLESQGKKEEALKVYEEIKDKYVNSQLVVSGEIDKYIERTSR